MLSWASSVGYLTALFSKNLQYRQLCSSSFTGNLWSLRNERQPMFNCFWLRKLNLLSYVELGIVSRVFESVGRKKSIVRCLWSVRTLRDHLTSRKTPRTGCVNNKTTSTGYTVGKSRSKTTFFLTNILFCNEHCRSY